MSNAVATPLLPAHERPTAERLRYAPRWLHAWAAFTVLATLALLALGSAVTTFRAGMADPVWPTSPLALAQSPPEQLEDMRYVIEHSHRLAGYVVGTCAIVLCAALWLCEPRRWLCWLGSVALVGVVIQGIFGGLRVTEHARWGLELRIVHGCFAQVVLALLVSIAVFTWRGWGTSNVAHPANLGRWALVVGVLLYLQIAFGVFLRHTYHPLGQRLHLLTAFLAVAGVVWLVRLTFEVQGDRPLTIAAVVLACLVALQLALGVEAWMVQLGSGTLPDMLPLTTRRVAVRTGHFLGGSLVFASGIVVLLLARRRAAHSSEGAA